MRLFSLALTASLLVGFVITGRADDPAGKDQPKPAVKATPEEIDRLIVQLGDDDEAKRSQAKKQLEAIGGPVVTALKKASESAEDPEVRKAALAMLDKFEAKAKGVLHVFGGHGNRVNGVAITADGKRAVSASWDRSIRYWDLDDHALIRQIDGNSAQPNSVALSADGKRILTGGQGAMRLWNLETGDEIRAFEYNGSVWDVAFSPDGKTALCGCGDGRVRYWELESGKLLKTLETHSNGVAWAAAFIRDGKQALTGGGNALGQRENTNGSLRQFDLATGKEVRKFEGHTKDIRHIAVSPDGKQFLSASFDGTVRLWDLETGKELKKYDGPGNFVESVAFTPDGKRAVCCFGPANAQAVALEDARVSLKLWDLATGKEVKQFQGHRGPILCLAISRDGRRLISGSADNTMRLWELPK